MDRFKISFNNSGYIPPRARVNLASNIAVRPPVPTPKNTALNAPMISRVHRAKAGCSACGKKIA